MTRVLHINSYFYSNALHLHLVNKLKAAGLEQCVFIPVEKKDTNSLPNSTPQLIFYIKKCFNSIDRYLWPIKIFKIWLKVFPLLKSNDFDIAHAHSLFVNGSIAYLANRYFKIPYVVTIRNSDINIFLQKHQIFRNWGFKIMVNAQNIITLSHSYFDVHLKKNYSDKDFLNFKKKHLVVPNGAEDFWFDNKSQKNGISDKVKILFVGLLGRNKNFDGVVKTCQKLHNDGISLELIVIGDGPRFQEFKNHEYEFNVIFKGRINERNELLRHYRNADLLFVPSFTESFGIVYIEAMTQSLPVIFTKDQGFDGFFKDDLFGFAVDPNNVNDMAAKIKKTLNDYDRLSHNAYKYADKFSWDDSIMTLREVYLKQ